MKMCVGVYLCVKSGKSMCNFSLHLPIFSKYHILKMYDLCNNNKSLSMFLTHLTRKFSKVCR